MVDDDLGDLRVAVQALNELTEASTLFSQWRDVPKLPSSDQRAPKSRTRSTRWLANSARRWPNGMDGHLRCRSGIMEASAKGAGREHTLGVNIELPFEQFSNPTLTPKPCSWRCSTSSLEKWP